MYIKDRSGVMCFEKALKEILKDDNVRRQIANQIARQDKRDPRDVDRYLRLIRDGKRGLGKKWRNRLSRREFEIDIDLSGGKVPLRPAEGDHLGDYTLLFRKDIDGFMRRHQKRLVYRGRFGSLDEAERYAADLRDAGYPYGLYIVVDCKGNYHIFTDRSLNE